MQLPKIVIVGRPNVGKSSLLNVLAGKRVSIVDPTAGVTRDRVAVHIEIPSPERDGQPRYVELIDTGGYGVEDAQNLTAEVERQIARGVEQANVILFVMDAQAGVTPLDQTVAEVLRHAAPRHAEVVLIANKVDEERYEADGWEASTLGFGEPVLVSAATKHNLHELYDRLREAIAFDILESRAEAGQAPDPGILIALVGKRNAGKSTLVNALAGDERVIVSDVEGTTRDSVDVRVEIGGHVFTLIDTAGMRKTKSLDGDIEYYANHRSLRAVRRADVCLLLIDAAVKVSNVDRQLVNEIVRHDRATVIVVNKWDLAEKDYTQEQYVDYLDDALGALGYAPVVFVSAKDNKGLKDALSMALNLYEQTNHRIGTGELNAALERIGQERGPSAKGGQRLKIYYGAQVAVNPPTIVLHVNHPPLFDNNYERFLLNRFRDELPFSEVPIKLIVRGKEKMSAEERIKQRG